MARRPVVELLFVGLIFDKPGTHLFPTRQDKPAGLRKLPERNRLELPVRFGREASAAVALRHVEFFVGELAIGLL